MFAAGVIPLLLISFGFLYVFYNYWANKVMNVPTDVLLYMHAVHICIKYEKNVVTLHKATIYDFWDLKKAFE